MLETSARLLRLLSLFQVRRYWSGKDLSERLEVTPRTLRRDVERLRSLGYPVHSTSGTAGGYQLGAGATLPPLLLDDDEAVAVAVGLRTAANGSVAGIEEASMRALTKLEQVLPSRLGRRVAALHSFIVPMANAGPTVTSETLAVIAGACRDNDELHFSYQSREGLSSLRRVEPHRLVHSGQRWYLVAWDVGRKDWRTFRVDRIASRLRTGPRFRPRQLPHADVAAYVAQGVAYEQYPCRAKVVLHASAERLAEWLPATAGMLEAIDERRCILHTGSYSFEMLAGNLALLGVDFEVQEPQELVEQFHRIAARFERAAKRQVRAENPPPLDGESDPSSYRRHA